MQDEKIELTWENFARLVYVAALIVRGTLRWDDERKVCIKTATGQPVRLLH
jgi:hypothetical protein